MPNIKDVQQYWDSRPCNIKHSPKEVGTLEYFEEVKERKYKVEPHIREFADYSRWKGKKVLEIGCSIGTDSIEFAKAGALVTSIDISEASLAIAQQRADLYGVNIKFYRADVEYLFAYIPIETYDLIYSFGVLHHTPNPRKAVKSIRMFMNSNSILKIMVYNKISWKVFWILIKYGKGAFWKLDKLIAKYSEAQTGCPVTYSYTKKSVKKLLKGFKIQELRIHHIFPYCIPEYKLGKYKKVFYFRWLPKFLFKWLESKLGWHLCLTGEKYE